MSFLDLSQFDLNDDNHPFKDFDDREERTDVVAALFTIRKLQDNYSGIAELRIICPFESQYDMTTLEPEEMVVLKLNFGHTSCRGVQFKVETTDCYNATLSAVHESPFILSGTKETGSEGSEWSNDNLGDIYSCLPDLPRSLVDECVDRATTGNGVFKFLQADTYFDPMDGQDVCILTYKFTAKG